MEMRSFGDLSGPFIPPARGGQPSSLIVLLHGWGADGNDLADLAYPISVRFPGAAFFVPNGPAPCKMNPAGREWFDIDDRVNGPAAAAPVIDAAITAALAALKLPASALALAGFSQGGMMSLHCGLRHATPPAAIVSFSGALLRHDDLADGVNYPPVLLVHGTDDQVVPFALQSASYDVMQSRSIMVETVACDGLGHGIDPDGLSAAIAFLAKYLPA
ncbi:phospholipase [Alphaproteobacteria bacterium]|nr:phospholipase [Alphaproteobacteria bacterium]MDA8797685.1 phospholipase [Alphaproteobacteria bacterium]